MAAGNVGGGGRGSKRTSGGEEMNGYSSSKVVVGGRGAGGYRKNGDVVPRNRRPVGLNNGGSVSDGGSSEEEEEEEEQEEDDGGEEVEVAAEEESEDSDEGREGVLGLAAEEVEEEEEEEEADDIEDDHLVAAVMDRGGGSSSQVRELVSYDDHEVEMMEEDDGYEEECDFPDSPVVFGRGRSNDCDKEMALPVSRGIVELGQTSASEIHHRELVVVPQKPLRGMMDMAKRKAEFTLRNGGEPKPKKKKVPAAPRKKATRDGAPRKRTRFSTSDKACMTLERAREVLVAARAAMTKYPKGPKRFARRHPETHTAVENSSTSDDERVPMQPPPSRVIQQVKFKEKSVKQRSRAPKGKTPKVEFEYHAVEEKPSYRSPHVDGPGHDHDFKLGRYSGTGPKGQDEDDREGYEKKDSRQDVYEQQITVGEKKVRKRRNKKEAEDPSTIGLVPGSVLRTERWVPPESPFGLIQESLYKDPWRVLLSCMLLNKTASRKMHNVIWDLFDICPDAESAINMDTAKIAEVVYSFGLQNKRAKMIQRFSLEYSRGEWTNVTQLHGIGKHAADAYAIFCQGLWREVEPNDQQLSKYWKWLWETNGLGSAFTRDTS